MGRWDEKLIYSLLNGEDKYIFQFPSQILAGTFHPKKCLTLKVIQKLISQPTKTIWWSDIFEAWTSLMKKNDFASNWFKLSWIVDISALQIGEPCRIEIWTVVWPCHWVDIKMFKHVLLCSKMYYYPETMTSLSPTLFSVNGMRKD